MHPVNNHKGSHEVTILARIFGNEDGELAPQWPDTFFASISARQGPYA